MRYTYEKVSKKTLFSNCTLNKRKKNSMPIIESVVACHHSELTEYFLFFSLLFFRLNREIAGGAWCPSKQLSASYSGQEWIQVDLQEFYIITAIATQGRFGNGMGVEFAEEYWIEYSRDNGTTWNKWTDMNGDYVSFYIYLSLTCDI